MSLRRIAYKDPDGQGPIAYTDYGPKNPTRGTWAGTSVLTLRYSLRPYCDMCGPFRGRYLRQMADGEHRCFGCDCE